MYNRSYNNRTSLSDVQVYVTKQDKKLENCIDSINKGISNTVNVKQLRNARTLKQRSHKHK